MSDPTWLLLRQANEALTHGQPEEAHRLLDRLIALGHRKVWDLTIKIVRAYNDRAELHLRQENPEAAWADLIRAESLGTTDPLTGRLRLALTGLGLAEVRAFLETGSPLQALEAATRLRERQVRVPELVPLEESASEWVLAQEMADRGDFALALSTVERFRGRLSCPTTGVDRFLDELKERQRLFEDSLNELQKAAEERHWRNVLRWTESAILAAPRHREAHQLRNRAWQMLHPDTAAYREVAPCAVHNATLPAAAIVAPSVLAKTRLLSNDDTAEDSIKSPTPTPNPAGLPKRFLLWIDHVGGYLVCLANRITIGQATAEGPIDVPLFADVSRLHATLLRDEEGYILEAGREVTVNGRPADRSVLAPGDRVTLGRSCQFLFQLPLAGSSTARLDVVSGHRLPMAVDGVLLMADSLILGNEPKCHIRLPDALGRIVLARHKDGLCVRHAGEFFLNDQRQTEEVVIQAQSCLSGPGFSFAIEPIIGPRLG